MLEDVVISEVEPRQIAIVRRTANNAELPTVMLTSLDQVWDFLRSHGVSTGHNVVFYHDQVYNLEIGVEYTGELPPDAEVGASQTPGGRVASIVYWGPYEDLTLAHTAIVRHCIGAGMRVAGPNWEVYGDWSDDPEKLRTDVFYLLRD